MQSEVGKMKSKDQKSERYVLEYMFDMSFKAKGGG